MVKSKKNKKKKIIKIGVVVIIFALFLYWFFVLRIDLSLNFDLCEKEGNPIMCCNDIGNCAIAGTYEWDGSEKGKEIVIPDEWDGNKVTKLGGFYGRGVPFGFGIIFPKEYSITDNGEEIYVYNEGWLSEITYRYDIKNVVFKLKIGKNLKEVGNAELCDYFPKADNKGNITLYHPVLYVECSKENKHFYAKDGKLYYRENDKLVESLEYD